MENNMTNVVSFEQYRNMKHLLETDAEFRAFVEGLLRELENPQPAFNFNNINTSYTISSVTFNGIDVTEQ